MNGPIKDAELRQLAGTTLPSLRHAGVSYRLERVIGEGAQGIVFLASRVSEQAPLSIVVKLLRPRAVRELADLAAASIGKEVAALERLSERVPSPPHVVRFYDTGTLRIRDLALELPWVAVEYVDGGSEGTTLRTRVLASVARGGFAFDAQRAQRALINITAGVAAIHEVGVLHRDVNPGNVLCSGSEASEVFKLADFGLARVSSASTFGNVLLGTPGYCAPEQSFPDKVGAGPHSDVFSIACCYYFVLTGEPYFTAPTIPEMLVAVYGAPRRRLRAAPALRPELQAQHAACAELDRVLAWATAADPRQRPQTASELRDALLGVVGA